MLYCNTPCWVKLSTARNRLETNQQSKVKDMNEHYYISEDMTMDDMVKALDALESVAYNLLRKQENTYNSMENTLFKAVNQAWKTAEAIAMVQDSSTASATK